jgi:CRP-like cAMP-binding protein
MSVQSFTDYIRSLGNLSEEEEKKVYETLRIENLPKGHLLFQQGEICRRVFFIQKGIARIYYKSLRGKEITVWLCAENTWLAAIDSFFQNKPTRDNCELLEDSIVFSLEYSALATLLNNPDSAKLAFNVTCQLICRISDIVMNLRFLSSKERFENLMQERPSIFLRVPLKYIASYLGITQETLSRMRAMK